MSTQHDFSKDDILVNTWGYDQTNHDFYLVTRISAKSIWIVPVEQLQMKDNGDMSKTVRPTLRRQTKKVYDRNVLDENGRPTLVDEHDIPQRRKTPRLSPHDNTWHVSMDHGIARKIDSYAELTATTYS